MSIFPALPFAAEGMEVSYALDRIGQLIFAAEPKSLRIYCSDKAMVYAMARRLYWLKAPLLLENEMLVEHISSLPYIKAKVAGGQTAEMGLILFERQMLPQDKYLLVLADNKFSYKSLINRQVYDNIWQLKAWFRQGYHIDTHIGLFGWRFLWHWTISQAMQSHDSQLHFRHQQRALDSIFDSSKLSNFAYLQILAGRQL
jgi:hypothetical protein